MKRNEWNNRIRKTGFWALSLMLGTGLWACQDNESTVDTETEQISSYSYPLVATGQTAVYDNDGNELSGLQEGDEFWGQDGNYQKGAPMQYVDNGDGTVTDLNTGLMWQSIPIPDKMTYDEAVAYCDSLQLAGYSDWRLPNLKELFSISDFGKGWPYLDTTYFKLASGIVDKSEQYWSSVRYVGVTVEGQNNAAFGVNHVTGHIKAYSAASDMGMGIPVDSAGAQGSMPPAGAMPPAGTMPADTTGAMMPPAGTVNMGSPLAKHVRAVRGTEYGINELVDNGDGTITDKATGLMWTQSDNGVGVDWQTALEYAESSTFAGYDDWRLPNVKELQSIADYNYSPTATDPDKVGPAINPLFNCTPIVSEAGYSDYAYYWTSTSACFQKGQPYYYAWYLSLGRAVNSEGEDFHGAGAVRFDTKHEGGPSGEDGERYYNYVFLVRDAD